jgi:hypothetical protein
MEKREGSVQSEQAFSLDEAERNALILIETQLRLMGEMLGPTSGVGREMLAWEDRLRSHRQSGQDQGRVDRPRLQVVR